MVLDDVWRSQDIAPFLAESPRSKLLFTTRDETIAAVTGAMAHSGELLTVEQAHDLLAKWTGWRLDTLPPEAQRGPAVLLGGLNNAWTLRLTDTLRFGFDIHDPTKTRIRDRQRPRQDWTFDYRAPYQKVTRDYALISRVMHPATEQMTLIVGGLGQWGTLGAVDFITDPVRLEKLRVSASSRQRDSNVQVVIGVDVVDGAIGPPKVLATYYR